MLDAVLAGGVILFAAGLRAPGLTTRPLWRDEHSTAWMAHLAPLELLKTGLTVHPPGYAQLAHLFTGIGDGGWSIRLPALAGGLASIAVAYGLLRMLGSRATAFFGALVMAASVYHIHYSQEARGYSWMSTFTGACLLFAIRHMQRPSLGRLAGALISALAACWFHYLGLLSLLGIVALLFTRDVVEPLLPGQRDKPTRDIRICWAALLGVVLGCAFLLRARLGTLATLYPSDEITRLNIGPRFLSAHFGMWSGLGPTWGPWFLGTAIIGFFAVLRSAPRSALLLLAACLGPFLIMGFVTWNSFYESRYLISALIPALVLCALGIQCLVRSAARWWSSSGRPRLEPSALGLVVVLTILVAQASAAAHRSTQTITYHPVSRADAFALRHVFLHSDIHPWLLRDTSDGPLKVTMMRVGPVVCPMPRWSLLDQEDPTHQILEFVVPGIQDWERGKSHTFVSPLGFERIEVHWARTSSDRVSEPPCSPPIRQSFVPKDMPRVHGEAHMVQYAQDITGDRIAYRRLSWRCEEKDLQVAVTIRSNRIGVASAYLEHVRRLAYCVE